MLQALLASADLTPDDVEIVEYPDFGQGAAVAQGAVDAATGFANNEPVQLQLAGEEVTILRVDDIVPLPGNGLIVGNATLDAKSDALAGFIAATLRAMEEIAANPEVGLDAAITAVPDLAAARDVQAAILDATIEVWTGPAQEAHGFGAIEPSDWEQSITYLETLGARSEPGHGRRRHRDRFAAGPGLTAMLGGVRPTGDAPVVVAARGPGRGGGRVATPGRGRAPVTWHDHGRRRDRRWRVHGSVDGAAADRAGAGGTGRAHRVGHLRRWAVGAERRVRHELVGRVPDADRPLRRARRHRRG